MRRTMNPVLRVVGVRRGALVAVLGAVALMATLGLAATASATPKGKFERFAHCPLANTHVTACLFAEASSGKFTVGTTTVPISKTIVLQGGIIEKVSENEKEELVITEEFVGAEGAETLPPTALPVPGGLLGIECNKISNEFVRSVCELLFENKLTEVTATTQLAASPSAITINEGNLLDGTGTALGLPIKVKLDNPLLGEACYIGSNASPVVLDLTTGTSGSVTGNPGKVKVEEGLLTVEENSLVNGTFSAPGVEGCGGILSFLLDPIVDAKLGLPAATGNVAVLKGELFQASPKTVKESE